jgi:hypothetical protein
MFLRDMASDCTATSCGLACGRRTYEAVESVAAVMWWILRSCSNISPISPSYFQRSRPSTHFHAGQRSTTSSGRPTKPALVFMERILAILKLILKAGPYVLVHKSCIDARLEFEIVSTACGGFNEVLYTVVVGSVYSSLLFGDGDRHGNLRVWSTVAQHDGITLQVLTLVRKW